MSTPFFTGGASSTDIIGLWDFALDGHTFMLDTRVSAYTGHSEFMHASVPLIRNQADSASSPSEASINPNDLWRRSQDSWHKGSGQSYLDRADSDSERYNTSKGVNPWTKWQLSLLPDTGHKHTSANTNLALVVVGGYLYYADGQVLRRTADITAGSPTWTTITATDASTIQSMCSDGYTVYLANAGGIFSTTRGAAAMTAVTGVPYSALVATLLRYVKGRLMAAAANAIYNVIAGGAAPAALYTHPNTDFTWVDFAEGQTVLYAAGFSGDKSLIYKTAVKADGTALDIPTVAGELPDGEIVRSIQGYLGFLLIGTDKGVRFAAEDAAGNLTLGSLIPTTSAVQCFEPQDRFCWYGLTNYDSVSTGLGRIDLSVATGPLTPAYASDLMATGSGAVLSAVTFQGLRVFAVSGLGVYGELSTLVGSGTIDSGQITYRLPDNKTAMFVDVKHDGTGQHAESLSVDGGSFVLLDTHTTSDNPFPAGQRTGARFQLRTTLTAVGGAGPTIRAITMRAYPVVPTVEMITVPLILAERVTLRDESEQSMDVGAELEFIKSLRASRELVPWQETRAAVLVIVDDFEWRPINPTRDFKAWNGTCLVSLKEVQ